MTRDAAASGAAGLFGYRRRSPPRRRTPSPRRSRPAHRPPRGPSSVSSTCHASTRHPGSVLSKSAASPGRSRVDRTALPAGSWRVSAGLGESERRDAMQARTGAGRTAARLSLPLSRTPSRLGSVTKSVSAQARRRSIRTPLPSRRTTVLAQPLVRRPRRARNGPSHACC